MKIIIFRRIIFYSRLFLLLGALQQVYSTNKNEFDITTNKETFSIRKRMSDAQNKLSKYNLDESSKKNIVENLSEEIFLRKTAEFRKKENALEAKQLKLYFFKAHKQFKAMYKTLDYNNSSLYTGGDKLLFRFLEYFDAFFPVNQIYQFNLGTAKHNQNLLTNLYIYINNSMNWYTFLDNLKEKLATSKIQSKEHKPFLLNVYAKKECSVKTFPVDNLGISLEAIFKCKFRTFELKYKEVVGLEIEKVKEDAYCKIINENFRQGLETECFDEKLKIVGKFVNLEEVKFDSICHGKIKIVEIFAESKVFISESVPIDNIKQLNIIAPVIEVVEKVKCGDEVKLKCDVDLNTETIQDESNDFEIAIINGSDPFAMLLQAIHSPKRNSKVCITQRIVLKIRQGNDQMEHMSPFGAVVFIITGDVLNENMLQIDVSGKLNEATGVVKVFKLSKEYEKSEFENNHAEAKDNSDAFFQDIVKMENNVIFENIQISLNNYKKFIVTQFLNKGKLENELFDFYENITKYPSLAGYNDITFMVQEFVMLKDSFFTYVRRYAESPENWKLDSWIFLFNNLMEKVKDDLKTDVSEKLFDLRTRLSCTLYLLKYEILQDTQKSVLEELISYEEIIVSNNITFLNVKVLNNKETIKKAGTDAEYIIFKNTIPLIDRIHTELSNILKQLNDSIKINKRNELDKKLSLLIKEVELLKEKTLDISSVNEKAGAKDEYPFLNKTIHHINAIETELSNNQKEINSINLNVIGFMKKLSNVINGVKTKVEVFIEAVGSVFDFSFKKDKTNQTENELPIKTRLKLTNNLIHEILQGQLKTMTEMLSVINETGATGKKLQNFTKKITYMILLWKYYIRRGEYPNNSAFHSLQTDLLVMKQDTSENQNLIDKVLDTFRTDHFDKMNLEKNSAITLPQKDLHKIYFQNIATSFRMVVNDIMRNVNNLVNSDLEGLIIPPNSKTMLKESVKKLAEFSSSFYETFHKISLIVQKYLYQKMVVRYAEEASTIKTSNLYSALYEGYDSEEIQNDCNPVFDLHQKAAENLIMFIFPFAKYYVPDMKIIHFLHSNLFIDEVTNIANYKIGDLGEKLILNSNFTITNTIKASKNEFLAYTYRPFYVWWNDHHSESLKQFISGEETTFKADISNGLDLNAVKFNRVMFNLKVHNKDKETDFRDIFNNFEIHVKHGEDNFYRCNNKNYLIKGSTLNWIIDVRNLYDFDETSTKIHDGDAVLSPYTTWTLTLIAKDHNSASLIKQYEGQVDLYLQGFGKSLQKDSPICNQRLESHYKLQP